MSSAYTIKGEQTKVHMSSSQSIRNLLRIQVLINDFTLSVH